MTFITMWNPIKHVDPDGRIAVAASALAQNRLLGTLSCGKRKYVSFDKNGNINAHRLNRSKSTSQNMTALKALTNSKVTYNFLVQGKSSNGKTDMIPIDANTELQQHINEAVNETKTNYDCGL